jgi:hypothetical protein
MKTEKDFQRQEFIIKLIYSGFILGIAFIAFWAVGQ